MKKIARTTHELVSVVKLETVGMNANGDVIVGIDGRPNSYLCFPRAETKRPRYDAVP
jgi:hypothetical protein